MFDFNVFDCFVLYIILLLTQSISCIPAPGVEYSPPDVIVSHRSLPTGLSLTFPYPGPPLPSYLPFLPPRHQKLSFIPGPQSHTLNPARASHHIMKRRPHGPITDPRSHGVFHEACCAARERSRRGSRERDVRRGVFYVEGVES